MVVTVFGDDVKQLLREVRTIAVVGVSTQPERPSYGVSRYMQEMGYTIIPVRPGGGEILGQRIYASLEEIPVPIDLVDIFRQSEFVPPIVESAIARGAKSIWMQEGVAHAEAARQARQAGLHVIEDACILKAHKFFHLLPKS